MNNRVVLWILVILTLSACKNNIYTFNRAVQTLDVKETEFEYLSAKVKIDFEDSKNSFKTSSNLMIRKDSIIWFSIAKGPAEVSRGIFTKDSLVILDKLKKTYSVFTFAELSKKLNFELDFSLVQAAILGNLIFPYDKENISTLDEFYNYRRRDGRFTFDTYIGQKSMKLEKLIINDAETGHSLQVLYKNFQLVDEQFLPYEVFGTFNYNKPSGEPDRKTIVNITFNKASIEKKPLRFPFRIPQKYEKK